MLKFIALSLLSLSLSSITPVTASQENASSISFKRGTPNMMQMMSITKETLENEYGSALPEFTVSDLMKHISSEQIKKVISRTSPICSTFSFLAEKDGKTYAISAYIMTPFALQTHDDISRFIKEHGAEKLDIKEEYDEGRGLVYSWGEKGNDIYIYFNLIPMNIYEKQKS